MAVCWDASWQRMPWVGLLTPAWPLTPYRLHRGAVRLDELKHLIVRSVFRGVFSLGVFFFTLWMKNVRFTVGADVCYVTVLPNTEHTPFSQAGTHTHTHTLANGHTLVCNTMFARWE